MTNARDKANIPVLNFQSKGIDDNADATAITIDSSERVSIGTSTAEGILKLDNTGQTSETLLTLEDTGGSGAHSQITLKNTTGTVASLLTNSDNLEFRVDDETIFADISGTEHMRITSGGKVGIGTSDPNVKLNVAATTFTPDNTNTSLIVEAPAVFSQAQHFYIYNAGAYNSSRPTGGIGAVNTSSLISLSAGSICNGNPGADGFKATATTSSLYDIGSGNHEFKTKTGLTVGDQFTHQTKMIIKDSGSVGIGTINPQEQLDISSNSPRIRFSDTSVTDLHHKIGSEANDLEISCDAGNDQASSHIGFKIDGSEKVRISDAGKVSIGNTNASSFGSLATDLVIGTTSGEHGLTIVTGTGNSARMQFSDNTSSPFVGAIEYSHGSNDLMFYTSASQKMKITSAGNVGIGTSSPVGKFDVAGSVYCDGLQVDGNAVIQTASGDVSLTIAANEDYSAREPSLNLKGYSTSSNPQIAFGDNNGYSGYIAYENQDNSMYFLTNNAERLRINSSGQIIVAGATADGKLAIASNAGSISRLVSLKDTGNAGGGRDYIEFFNVSGGSAGSIEHSGTSTVAYRTSSDYRLKENVNYDFDATSRLKQLKPARFNFIEDADITVDGFIAHEVSDIVPEAIGKEKDALQVWKDGEELPEGVAVGDNKLDADGNTIPDYQGIDQSKLVPLMVKTIQELEARITTLEANNP